MVTCGGAVLAASFAALTWTPVWPGLAAAMTGIGFGFYMLHNTLQTHATQMAPEARGAGVALFAPVLFLGQCAGAGRSDERGVGEGCVRALGARWWPVQ